MTPAERAREVIAAVHAAGGTIRRRGKMIRIEAQEPLPSELVERIRAAKPELLGVFACPDEIAYWQTRHAAALARWRPLYPEAKAASIAWGKLQNRWHKFCGEKVSAWTCAGCGLLLSGLDTLDMGDGNRVHLGDGHGLDCLFAYGERRRPRRVADLAREFEALLDELARHERRAADRIALLQGQIEDIRHRLAAVERAAGLADLGRAPVGRDELRRCAGGRA